jgi:hypothetical protein
MGKVLDLRRQEGLLSVAKWLILSEPNQSLEIVNCVCVSISTA